MPQPRCTPQRRRRRSVLTTLAVCAVLAYVLAGHRDEFRTALGAAPLWILLVATALQLLALVSRTESWRICVAAAGGTVGRRCLYRAASLGYVGSQLNSQIGTAARIGALRRAAPEQCPRVPALIAAEVPILAIEGALAALTSFTLVGPLGLPWWLPLLLFGVAVLLVAGLRNAARRWRRASGAGWRCCVAPKDAAASSRWSLWHGAAPAAAAGVLLTATGTLGALSYAGWAGIDRLWALRPAAWRRPLAPRPHVTPEPQPAIGATR